MTLPRAGEVVLPPQKSLGQSSVRNKPSVGRGFCLRPGARHSRCSERAPRGPLSTAEGPPRPDPGLSASRLHPAAGGGCGPTPSPASGARVRVRDPVPGEGRGLRARPSSATPSSLRPGNGRPSPAAAPPAGSPARSPDPLPPGLGSHQQPPGKPRRHASRVGRAAGARDADTRQRDRAGAPGRSDRAGAASAPTWRPCCCCCAPSARARRRGPGDCGAPARAGARAAAQASPPGSGGGAITSSTGLRSDSRGPEAQPSR